MCVSVYGNEATTRKPVLPKAVSLDIRTREEKKHSSSRPVILSPPCRRDVCPFSFPPATGEAEGCARAGGELVPPPPPLPSDVAFRCGRLSPARRRPPFWTPFRPFVDGASRVQDRLPHMTRVFVPVISASISVNQCR